MNTILDPIATLAPVFAYDRAGVEKSDKQYRMPTPKIVADDLKAILTALKIPPPYILVGHSLGGIYIRGYAGFTATTWPVWFSSILGISPKQKMIGEIFCEASALPINALKK